MAVPDGRYREYVSLQAGAVDDAPHQVRASSPWFDAFHTGCAGARRLDDAAHWVRRRPRRLPPQAARRTRREAATTLQELLATPMSRSTHAAALALLKGHTSRVEALAFTPDGNAPHLRVRRRHAPRLGSPVHACALHTLEGHTAGVWSVAVTPDGTRAVSASFDATLRVWDLDSGRTLHVLQGHATEVYAVAVMPDGKRAVSSSADATLRVWDLQTGRTLHTLRGHTDDAKSFVLTPDGARALSASWDGTVRVWNLDSGRALRTLEGSYRRRPRRSRCPGRRPCSLGIRGPDATGMGPGLGALNGDSRRSHRAGLRGRSDTRLQPRRLRVRGWDARGVGSTDRPRPAHA